ncbi:MAG: radical SAM protein [Gemmatimonadetes bacterium]|nr:radical SAM protein [Gemmatimonadota bacterium]
MLDERRRGTRFVELPIKSVLNSPQQTGMNFWSLNPYVGCEFGCSYCYARYAHRYVVERGSARGALGPAVWDDETFERQIFVKVAAPEIAALTARPSRLGGHTIVIGTATDPYQPAERTFRITRRVLERLAQVRGLGVGIITKSPLVTRDVDVLLRLAERSRVTVIVSLISMDALLVRKLEVRSPTPAVRLEALAKLVRAGLHAGVLIAPVLPGITDDVPHLEALMRGAKDAGAAFARADPLRLYPPIRRRFLPVVAQEFPSLLDRYERAFDARGFVTPAYTAALKRRVARLQRKVGFEAADERAGGSTGQRAEEAIQWEMPL